MANEMADVTADHQMLRDIGITNQSNVSHSGHLLDNNWLRDCVFMERSNAAFHWTEQSIHLISEQSKTALPSKIIIYCSVVHYARCS